MSQAYEYETAEVADIAEEVQVPVKERFVPREPDPSSWPIASPRPVFTRGEELFVYVVAGFLALILLLSVILFASTAKSRNDPTPETPTHPVETQPEDTVKLPDYNKGPYADGKKGNVLYQDAANVQTIDLSGLSASAAALAKVADGTVIAGQGTDEKVYPASLTKIMTLIVAVEHLRSEAALQEMITISEEVHSAMSKAGASGIGLAPGEKLTVESLLYLLMLQSDGVAACELARYIATTEEAFVALMNQKAADMGLKGTHFVNPTGLYSEDHYSTCRDLATMLGYAMNMSLCRKIMTEDAFEAPCTQANGNTFPYHVYNNLLVTQFNKYDTLNPAKAGKLTVIAGKTGYTPESKYCLATCGTAADGSLYICVTVGANSYEDSIKGYQAIYSRALG